MTVSTPLGITDFWQKIRFIGRPEFELLQYKRQSMDGAGNMISSKIGQPKWRADVVTSNGLHADDLDTQAMIKLLIGRDAPFLAYDIRRPYPRLDPKGTIVSGSTVQVRSVGTNNRSLSLKGLPAGYRLSISDLLSVGNGSGGRALFEIVEAATANGSGNTDEFEVQPFFPVWLAVNLTVDLIKPLARFKILPGSYKPQSGTGNMSGGISFSMISVP